MSHPAGGDHRATDRAAGDAAIAGCGAGAGADFRVLRGPSMLEDAYFDFLTHFPAEFVTILHARAIAGGPVDRTIYERWKGQILDGLKAAGKLDGVYLALHGGMYIDGMFDAEGNLIAAVRGVVDQFVERLERKHKTVPQYPFEGFRLVADGDRLGASEELRVFSQNFGRTCRKALCLLVVRMNNHSSQGNSK